MLKKFRPKPNGPPCTTLLRYYLGTRYYLGLKVVAGRPLGVQEGLILREGPSGFKREAGENLHTRIPIATSLVASHLQKLLVAGRKNCLLRDLRCDQVT